MAVRVFCPPPTSRPDNGTHADARNDPPRPVPQPALQGTIELPVADFPTVFAHGYHCPICRTPFDDAGPHHRTAVNPLRDLVNALESITADAGRFAGGVRGQAAHVRA